MESTDAVAAAQAAYDNTVLFLVWTDAPICDVLKDGRTVEYFHHICKGPRLCMFGYYIDETGDDLPEGADYYTAEELGFDNAQMLLHARDKEALCNDSLRPALSRPQRLRLINRIMRVDYAIKVHMAAWYRRRHALSAFGR
jgi:hypothetical protein